MFEQGRAVTVLDGSNLRRGISRDLGFTAAERSENVRRAAEVAGLMNDAGMICICAFVAPAAKTRQRAASVVGGERFILVHLDAPMEVCRKRSPELYDKVDEGKISNFPGIDFEYEKPEAADLVLATHEVSVKDSVAKIIALLEEREII